MHNQHRSPDPTKIERATATNTVVLFFLYTFHFFARSISRALNFTNLSMQMNAEFKEEQIGTPFVWVGALEEGVRGGGGKRGSNLKNARDVQYFIFSTLLRS